LITCSWAYADTQNNGAGIIDIDNSPILTWVKNNVESTIVIVSTTFTIGGIFVRNKRRLVVGINRKFSELMRFDLLEDISKKIANIDSELNFNGGGSVKDRVAKISNIFDNEFWIKPQPVFMCSDCGENAEVSEAYCQLVGVRSVSELEDLSWRSFVDIGDLSGYDELWKSALSERRGVVAVIGFQDKYQKPRGKWRVRITPITPFISKNEDGFTFIGYFAPADELAQSIWDEHGWHV